jgi:uroporphyrinogen decarboxylase
MHDMTSRERLNATLNHIEPDKFPIDFGGVHTSLHIIAHKNLMNFFGLEGPNAKIQDTFQQIVFPDPRILEKFQVDVIGVYSKSPSNWKLFIDSEKDEYTDEWGTTYVRPKGGYFFDIKIPVMKDFTFEDLKNYKMPDPTDKARFSGLRKEVLDIHKNNDKAIILFNASWGLWESLWQMRGFEQSYIDIATDKRFVNFYWDKFLWWSMSFWNSILKEVGDLVDVVQIGDDLGTQIGPMFNPEIYRSMLKPRHKKLVNTIKSKTRAKVYIHSCGDVAWAIKDFIECGIDILNPVQVKASNMDSKKLKKEFGNEITFWGGGCDPEVLLRGTRKEIEEEVKRRIDDLSLNGGFVFASIHNIQANTPPENIATMFQTAINLRKY